MHIEIHCAFTTRRSCKSLCQQRLRDGIVPMGFAFIIGGMLGWHIVKDMAPRTFIASLEEDILC